MTVTVSVDATHRVSRFELTSLNTPASTVLGYGEVLLQSPDKPSDGAEILQARVPWMPTLQALPGDKVTYGVMPGSVVNRPIRDVMDEKVDVDGKPVDFKTVLAAMEAFFEKWRVEDAAKPPPQMLTAAPPQVTPPPEPFEDEPPGG